MGLFDKLFGKQQEKTYSIDEAATELQKQLDEIQNKNKTQTEAAAARVRQELNQLGQLVKEFASKPTPEFAKRSENVKERFCTIAIRQLNNIPEEPGELLNTAGNLLNTLGGLTQRQILHINIFFKDDFSPIGRKMKELEQLLKMDESGKDHRHAVQLYQKIKSLEVREDVPVEPLERFIAEMSERLESAKGETIDEPKNEHLARIRKSLEELRQEINSFLPVQKLLKKYAYAKHLKDPMIEEYIDSPSSALIMDEHLKIIDYVEEASKMFSELNQSKLDAILRGRLLLNEKRKELEKVMKKELDESANYEEEKRAYDKLVSEKRNKLAMLEQEIKETQKQLEEAREEKKELEEELTKTRVEFCMLGGKLLNGSVG